MRRAERLVVGGGIGGLTTALALAKRSMSCTVVERQTEFGEIGAGIQLAPNALRVLDGLGVLHGVMANAVMPRRARLMNARTGAVITALDFGEAFRARFGYPYIVTHRSDLLNAILSACRASPLITLETSMAVLGLSAHDASVRVRCENGCEWEAGVVIGADGLRSTVRRYVLDDGEPDYVGHVAYRGTVPIDAAPGVVARDEITWWVGPGMHLIQYPVRRGELLNQVFVFEADTVGDPDGWGPPEELGRFFGDKVPAVREGAAVLDKDRRWILRDRPPDRNWTRGRATLLGDAAHPMVQYLAQGACQALEDAVVVAECLALEDDVERGLARYQAVRIPRATATQMWGRTMGEIVHADGVTAMLRDALLRGREPTDFGYVEWLYQSAPQCLRLQAEGEAAHARRSRACQTD